MSGDELVGIFREEAETLLARMADGMLRLEQGGAQPEGVAEIFRAAHTLKGSAALVGFDGMGEVAHVLEDLLAELRAGEREATSGLVDVVLETVDGLRDLLTRALSGEDPAPSRESAALREALEAFRDRGDDDATTSTTPPASGPAPVAASVGGPASAPPQRDTSAILVPLDRLDRLVRLAGESRTATLTVAEALEDPEPDVVSALDELERTLAALQDETLRTRMVTIEQVAEPLRRAARDIARASGKQVDYVLEGENVELDRGVLDALREPLLHLVRNAVDHGIESPEERREAGKPEAGSVRVSAERRGARLVVEVSDDGAGIDVEDLRSQRELSVDRSDAELLDAIFSPGVSTAAEVTDVSGRGVGLDVVRTSVAAVRGSVEVENRPGEGATFTLAVPITLAVLGCLLVRVEDERYAIPTHAVQTITDAADRALVGLEGGSAVWVAGDVVPLVDLGAVLGTTRRGPAPNGPAVVLRSGGRPVALHVDELLGRLDLTLQGLGTATPPAPLVAGASIAADGSVILMLDPVEVAARAAETRASRPRQPEPVAPTLAGGLRVLVVDDALTVRELQRSILERAGYRVATAPDGGAALAAIRAQPPDLVLTDIEMPGLDGFELVEAIRAQPELASLPVLIVTSRVDEADRRRGLEVGADGYLVKQVFDEPMLLEAVARVLGIPRS